MAAGVFRTKTIEGGTLGTMGLTWTMFLAEVTMHIASRADDILRPVLALLASQTRARMHCKGACHADVFCVEVVTVHLEYDASDKNYGSGNCDVTSQATRDSHCHQIFVFELTTATMLRFFVESVALGCGMVAVGRRKMASAMFWPRGT